MRDVSNGVHQVGQLRLSIREASWRPAPAALSRRLLSEAVAFHPAASAAPPPPPPTAAETGVTIESPRGPVIKNSFEMDPFFSCLR